MTTEILNTIEHIFDGTLNYLWMELLLNYAAGYIALFSGIAIVIYLIKCIRSSYHTER